MDVPVASKQEQKPKSRNPLINKANPFLQINSILPSLTWLYSDNLTDNSEYDGQSGVSKALDGGRLSQMKNG